MKRAIESLGTPRPRGTDGGNSGNVDFDLFGSGGGGFADAPINPINSVGVGCRKVLVVESGGRGGVSGVPIYPINGWQEDPFGPFDPVGGGGGGFEDAPINPINWVRVDCRKILVG